MQCGSKRYKDAFYRKIYLTLNNCVKKLLKNIKISDLIMTLCCRIDVLASSSFYYFITFLRSASLSQPFILSLYVVPTYNLQINAVRSPKENLSSLGNKEFI